MTFQEQINAYMEKAGISQKELANASGLSNPTISRYCSGARTPASDSAQIQKIAAALSALGPAGDPAFEEADIIDVLNRSAGMGLTVDYDIFLQNLNLLLKSQDIKGAELARALNYDASHISKVLSGSRRPGNLTAFITDTAAFVTRKCSGNGSLSGIARLTGTTEEQLGNSQDLCNHLILWLGSNLSSGIEEPVGSFLEKIDDFDLNEYMKAIHFDEIRVPQAPLQLPTRKTYFGLPRMMESELDFIKTTVLSRSMEDCILYSDMPLEDMAADPDFPKKWLFGMAMMLKKGLRLHIIHDVNRPFPEMMLGLESHIPMYMTGLISPYYLPASQNTVFTHLLKVSGAAVLEGSAIAGKQGDGKYVLYRSKDDIRHYRQRAEDLLKKASPLMEIYTREQKTLYSMELDRAWQNENRRTVSSRLPLCTIPSELLEQILKKTALPEEQKEEIRKYRDDSRMRAEHFLENHSIHLQIPSGNQIRNDDKPPALSLADLFIENDIPYTPEEYETHLKETLRFAKKHPNLTIEQNPHPAFHNISFTVAGDRLVTVSKEKSPAIHFVIHHKKMVQAFRNFIPPIVEE